MTRDMQILQFFAAREIFYYSILTNSDKDSGYYQRGQVFLCEGQNEDQCCFLRE